jgi:hypothetical protein
MPVNTDTFIEDLQTFFKESIDWCTQESERESAHILNTLQAVMEDVKRRSKMSETAEMAFRNAESRLIELRTTTGFNTQEVLSELQAMQSDNLEVSNLMNPVIEALQFQDQFAKNLQGINGAINCWFKLIKSRNPSDMTPEETSAFVSTLLENLSSPAERNIVRRHFGSTDFESSMDASDRGYI